MGLGFLPSVRGGAEGEILLRVFLPIFPDGWRAGFQPFSEVLGDAYSHARVQGSQGSGGSTAVEPRICDGMLCLHTLSLLIQENTFAARAMPARHSQDISN